MWNIPTQEQLAQVPPLESQAEKKADDVVIYLHFFVGGCDWWIAEFDGADTFFGFACLGDPQMAEWGTISFSELQELAVKTPIRDIQTGGQELLRIEVDHDLYWQPRRFGEIERAQRIAAGQ